MTKSQCRRIVNAHDMAPRLYPELSHVDCIEDWIITDKGREIRLYTSMNNFDMREYLQKLGLQEDVHFKATN